MLGLIFLIICVLYLGSALAGWRLARSGRMDLGRLVRTQRSLTDPLTSRFQRWHDRVKIERLRRKQWVGCWFLISANNLLAVAFVTRTLYGVSLVLPVYLTLRQGIAHGVLATQPAARPGGAWLGVAALEFVAYLLATALGVNVGTAFLAGGSGALPGALWNLVNFYPAIAAAVLAGAALEVRLLRSSMPENFRLPSDLDADEVKAQALEILQRKFDQAT